MIDIKAIREIICETHLDNTFLYDNLDNQFKGFKYLLGTNYKIKNLSLDGKVMDTLDPPYVEWDTHWILKENV